MYKIIEKIYKKIKENKKYYWGLTSQAIYARCSKRLILFNWGLVFFYYHHRQTDHHNFFFYLNVKIKTSRASCKLTNQMITTEKRIQAARLGLALGIKYTSKIECHFHKTMFILTTCLGCLSRLSHANIQKNNEILYKLTNGWQLLASWQLGI